MKKILFCIVILQFSTAVNAASLNSVFSKDGSDVWAVGANGYIIRSSNGGISWSNIAIDNTNYNSVFANSQFVWIAGDNGILQLSSDNGASWNQVTIAGGLNLKSVFFISSSTGWIAGNNGTILKSTNNGLNWTIQMSFTINNLNSIIFINELNGVACGANGTILITTNGGNNWNVSSVPLAKELLSVDMKAGVIFASGVDASVIKSTNNGGTWTILDYKILTKSDVNSVFMLDQNTYYSCGGGGFIRKSTDGGVTFMFQTNPLLADLYKIYFYDNNKGWAAGRDNNVVLRTTDGGNTWQMPSGTIFNHTWSLKQSGSSIVGNPLAMHPADKKSIFVCLGNKIYRSGNVGETWNLLTTITNIVYANAFVVSPKDTNLMLVSGSDKVLRSTNYGNTWNVTWAGDLPGLGKPMEMDPNHPDTIYLAPNSSSFWRSTNFGLNWTKILGNRFRSPCYISVMYENSNMIFCADDDPLYGRFYKSTNYGLNWTLRDSSTSSEIPFIALSNLDLNLLYTSASWSGGYLKKSTNQGDNWMGIPTQITGSWAVDIAKDDPTTITYASYGQDKAFISTNGGSNFIELQGLTPYNYSLLLYDRKTLLAVQSSGVYKLSVNYYIPIGIQPTSNEIPPSFRLHQNYPNPFNPSTKIKFDIPAVETHGNASLQIFDILGREAATLVNEQLKPGTYEVEWDATNFPSGVYYYKLSSGDYTETRKMVLVK